MGASIAGLVFQPPKTTPLNAERRERLWITTAHGINIPAFFIDRRAPLTVLFSHGNAEDLGMIYDWFKSFSAVLSVNVFAYDYTGYGKSRESRSSVPVEPSEEHVYNDVLAVYDHLRTVLNIKPESLVLYGRSLGSGPTCFLAERLSQQGTPCAGVILQSPLLSAFRVAFNFRFTLPGDLFPNCDRMKNIKSPVFIIHGTRDEVVPFWHGQELFLACERRYRARPFWVHGAGHNNIESLLRQTTAFHDHIRSFFDQCFPTTQQHQDFD
mmetsp:Transcript_64925/g.130546  ORF Transcript_64925/g.130546 Transcript_64925/m.130546 type:complete len:268 (+) Transcript_64925:123-926(+)